MIKEKKEMTRSVGELYFCHPEGCDWVLKSFVYYPVAGILRRLTHFQRKIFPALHSKNRFKFSRTFQRFSISLSASPNFFCNDLISFFHSFFFSFFHMAIFLFPKEIEKYSLFPLQILTCNKIYFNIASNQTRRQIDVSAIDIPQRSAL